MQGIRRRASEQHCPAQPSANGSIVACQGCPSGGERSPSAPVGKLRESLLVTRPIGRGSGPLSRRCPSDRPTELRRAKRRSERAVGPAHSRASEPDRRCLGNRIRDLRGLRTPAERSAALCQLANKPTGKITASPGKRFAAASSKTDTSRTFRSSSVRTFPLAGNRLSKLRIAHHQQNKRLWLTAMPRFRRRAAVDGRTTRRAMRLKRPATSWSSWPVQSAVFHGRCYAIRVSSVRRHRRADFIRALDYKVAKSSARASHSIATDLQLCSQFLRRLLRRQGDEDRGPQELCPTPEWPRLRIRSTRAVSSGPL